MAGTRILNLAGAPIQANPEGHELGEPGRWIRLTNAGDDPVYWAVGARAPSAMPGIPIPRGEAHEITLPALPLWAWASGGSRLLVTPIGKPGERGNPAGRTGAMILTALPVAMPDPPGDKPSNGEFVLVNAGGGKANLLISNAPLPDPLTPSDVLDTGEAFFGLHDASVATEIFCWTESHGGATLLLSWGSRDWRL